MRFAFTLFCLIGFGVITARAQLSTCSTAAPFCFDSAYSYTRGVGGTAETGPDYGCLQTDKNPNWYYMKIANAGNITFDINGTGANGIRHILWGPFVYPFSNCGSNLSADKITSCYNNNTVVINSAVAGQYYILLITNNSPSSTGVTFVKTSGTGSSNCDILCNLTGITATAGTCQSGANLDKYAITGTITTQSPPNSGILIVSSSSGVSDTILPPFSTSQNYTLPYTRGLGDTCTITATYSANTYCTKSTTVITPRCCSISAASVSYTVCESQPLSLSSSGTSGSNYFWTGPSGYTSNQQNPIISRILTSQAGTYRVYLTNGSCSTATVNVNVTVNPKPAVKNIIHR